MQNKDVLGSWKWMQQFVSLSWPWTLIWSILSIAGCEFATRRDRSCSLRRSWGWTLHSDAFHLRTFVSSQYWEPVGQFWKAGKGWMQTLQNPPLTSAQKHCNHQEEQISTKCHGGGFMTQILKLLRLLSERHLFSVGYQKGRKRKIPKQSFPMNRKEPKIGNYLLFGFSFKGMRMFSEEIFASALSLLLSISERLVHARSHLQECAWSQTIHWKLLHFQSMFSWHFYVIQWDTLNCVLPSHQSSLHSIEHLISAFSLQGKTHRKECPVQY